MRRLTLAAPVLSLLVASVFTNGALAMWLDPAFTGGGGAGPAPPQPGIALNGGRFTDPGVISFGDAGAYQRDDAALLDAPVEAMAATPDGHGYWMATASGTVIGFGDAVVRGGLTGDRLEAPIVGMAASPDGDGYWLVDVNGGVFPFGDARYFGSMLGHAIAAPIVAIVSSPTGIGYWELGEDGTIYHFGDAHQFGYQHHAFAPMVGLAATPDGGGYWEVGSDGGVFGFGDAHFYGSLGASPLYGSIVGIARTSDGRGYWLAGDDGAVFSFGDAHFWESNALQVPTPAIAQITATPDDAGYWLMDPTQVLSDFVRPGPSPNTIGYNIVQQAASQLGGNPAGGFYCNVYGPCEEWCALFATWAWEEGGIGIPRFAFTGFAYEWAAHTTGVLPATARPIPGDLVFYGSGPQSTYTSLHMGVVAEVWPDGAMITIDGDSGPGPNGSANVVVNGPFLPGFSRAYNGMPIYGYAVP